MIISALVSQLAVVALNRGANQTSPQLTEMAGYLIVPHERVDPKFNGGFSMYVAAWPLQKTYPGSDFQSGLFGTWMFPQFEGKAPKDHYTDIEGGLGWWRDTRFATETPKFIMGGVALNFSEWANGPGAGKGRDWKNPTGLYAIAQLSPWVLWPPDGLNLKQGTKGELFGYGYLPLPLTEPKSTTAGKPVPTGNNAWTLFLNSANFKGPVAFFTPHFWSKASAKDEKLAGMFLDTKPSDPNRAVQMETQHVPAMVAKDSAGTMFARIAPTHFPGEVGKDSRLIHRSTAYAKGALWDDVSRWFGGGQVASGKINEAASSVHTFKTGGYATWKIHLPGVEHSKSADVDWASYASPIALDPQTYGYRWKRELMGDQGSEGSLVTLPEFYRLTKKPNGKEVWAVVRRDEVPEETGLRDAKFPPAKRPTDPYVTPSEAQTPWKSPGPKAGPFVRKLGDGSEVTYYWYRFADQPALMNADLTPSEREAIQKRVEMIHRNWKKDRNYLPEPSVGKLASVDPALLVKPPKGMEVGYVPIVTRQGWSGKR
jgi:hypothetical protein